VIQWSDGGRSFQARGPSYKNAHALADLSATTRLNVLRGVGGSQTGPHPVDGTHHVGRIRRTLTGVDECIMASWYTI